MWERRTPSILAAALVLFQSLLHENFAPLEIGFLLSGVLVCSIAGLHIAHCTIAHHLHDTVSMASDQTDTLFIGNLSTGVTPRLVYEICIQVMSASP